MRHPANNCHPRQRLSRFRARRARRLSRLLAGDRVPDADSARRLYAPQDTVAASPNVAYVVVARDWDGGADAPPPASLVVLQSRIGFEVHWNTTVHIPVDDSTFAGNCAHGSCSQPGRSRFHHRARLRRRTSPAFVTTPPRAQRRRRLDTRAPRIHCAAALLFTCARAGAQAGPPAAHEDVAFDFMNLSRGTGCTTSRTSAGTPTGRSRTSRSWKLPFSAPYTNAERQHQVAVDRLRAELHRARSRSSSASGSGAAPRPTSFPRSSPSARCPDLRGLGGSIQNFELQKSGSETPSLYRRATVLPPDHRPRRRAPIAGLEPDAARHHRRPPTHRHHRRQLQRAGHLRSEQRHRGSAPDVLQHGVHDPLVVGLRRRRARLHLRPRRRIVLGPAGRSRIGRMQPPQNPNTLPSIFASGSTTRTARARARSHDQRAARRRCACSAITTTCTPEGSTTRSRRSRPTRRRTPRAAAASFNYGSGNFAAPDLCWVRADNDKGGIGMNLEQYVAKDIGLFLRAHVLRRRSEVDAFNSADRELSFGAVAGGALWRRPFDVAGAASAWLDLGQSRQVSRDGRRRRVRRRRALAASPRGRRRSLLQLNILRAVWLTGGLSGDLESRLQRRPRRAGAASSA